MPVNAKTANVVFHANAAGCASMVSTGGGSTGPTECGALPTAAAEVFYEYDGAVCLVFLCDTHRDVIEGARDLTDADRAEVADRRHQHAEAMAGRPYRRPRHIKPGRRPAPDRRPF